MGISDYGFGVSYTQIKRNLQDLQPIEKEENLDEITLKDAAPKDETTNSNVKTTPESAQILDDYITSVENYYSAPALTTTPTPAPTTTPAPAPAPAPAPTPAPTPALVTGPSAEEIAAEKAETTASTKKGPSVLTEEEVEDLAEGALDSMYKNTQYDAWIVEYSEKNGLDPWLVKSLIQKESSYNPNVVSSAGCRGLMQLGKGAAEDVGVDYNSLFDPETNIAAGTKYLAMKLKEFDNNLELALAAYNAGSKNVQDAGYQVPNFVETQNYVKLITDWYGRVQTDGKGSLNVHHWTQNERDEVEANLKERFGNYKYEVSYELDGTYTFKIYDSNGNVVDPEDAEKAVKLGYNKGLEENKTDLSQTIPENATILPNIDNTGWNSPYGQAIINNYGNNDGTIDTGRLTKDWVNAGGTAYTYTGTGAQEAWNAIQNGTWDSHTNYGTNNSGYTNDWGWTGFDVFSVGGNPYGGGIVYNEYGQIDYRNSWFSFGSGGGGDSLADVDGNAYANPMDRLRNCNVMMQECR